LRPSRFPRASAQELVYDWAMPLLCGHGPERGGQGRARCQDVPEQQIACGLEPHGGRNGYGRGSRWMRVYVVDPAPEVQFSLVREFLRGVTWKQCVVDQRGLVPLLAHLTDADIQRYVAGVPSIETELRQDLGSASIGAS
jgi:hypothetical protein